MGSQMGFPPMGWLVPGPIPGAMPGTFPGPMPGPMQAMVAPCAMLPPPPGLLLQPPPRPPPGFAQNWPVERWLAWHAERGMLPPPGLWEHFAIISAAEQ